MLGFVADEAYFTARPKSLHQKDYGAVNPLDALHPSTLATILNQGRELACYRIAMKAMNRLRRIYHLKRQGKRLLEQAIGDSAAYNPNPRVTQSFSSSTSVRISKRSSRALFVPAIEEIIVVDDGSSDGALEILPHLLTGRNRFHHSFERHI